MLIPLIIIMSLEHNLETFEVVIFIFLSTIFNSFSLTFYSIFQAHEKMEFQAISTIISSIFIFVGILLLIHYQLDILMVFIYLFISWTINLDL